MKSWVLWCGVVAMNCYGFPNSTCIPVVDGGDELSVVPHDAMLVLLCVLDDGSLSLKVVLGSLSRVSMSLPVSPM